MPIAFETQLNKRDFLESIKEGFIPPLYTEIPYISPAAMYANFSGTQSFLFESVKGPPKIARYSFIGFEPYLTFKVKNNVVELKSNGKNSLSTERPLKRLKELLDIYRQRPAIGLPPFQGGAVGLFSYDFVRYIEDIPETAVDDLHLPDAHFLLMDRLIAFDHVKEKAWAIVCPGVRDTGFGYKDLSQIDWKEKFHEAEHELGEILRRVGFNPSNVVSNAPPAIEVVYGMKKEDYISMVRKAKEYISAGDIFQANLSLRLSSFIGDIHPFCLYTILRDINPAPFAFFMDLGDYSIASSSPERLFLVRDGIIETRPIAGTRPRGRDSAEDEIMRSELLLNEKERAEHIMLIDLERNDLGKVADYSSVSVDEIMITEDYSHVIHIVSNIKGRLASGMTMFDSIRAVFPGGTITGVPKVRCMEIIDELEPVRRGPYTGSAGYFGFSGNADFNIIIRTFVIKDKIAYVQAGAGIVADSDPEREYHETLKKAEALIKTLHSVNKKLV
ncbi:MAG: anthranilate synthase component I family protein [Nitrospirae bacterium]|nr:anthranilate synthase component I family protein [Nitrospirota bacterium]